MASTFWGNWGARSSVSASVNGDGTVNLVVGSVDLSTSRTAVAMQLAETLGIPLDAVSVKVVDTDSVGFNDTSGGSRTTFATGLAAYELGKKLQEQMAAVAADFWDGCDTGRGRGKHLFFQWPNAWLSWRSPGSWPTAESRWRRARRSTPRSMAAQQPSISSTSRLIRRRAK